MSDAFPPSAPQQAPASAYAVSVHDDASRTARPAPWGHGVVAVLALIGLVLNFIGLSGFPGAAPIEAIMAFGIGVDLFAVIVACVVGFGVTVRMRPVRPSKVFPWVGLGMSALTLVIWAVNSGGLWETLTEVGRGRYMDDTVGAFAFGIPWALGAIFCAFGLRSRGSKTSVTIASWAGIVMWAIVLFGVVASSLLYGMDLTD